MKKSEEMQSAIEEGASRPDEGKRLICSDFGEVDWERFRLPRIPGPASTVIKSELSLISPGTELAIYSGAHIGYQSTPVPNWLTHPVRLGYSLAGTVHEVGQDVNEWNVGDTVLAHAPHGDWAVCEEDTLIVRPVPKGASLTDAVLSTLAGFSMVAVRQARIELGEPVVVLGLGLIGQFAAQLSKLSGAYPVIGIDFIESRRGIAEQVGVLSVDAGASDPHSLVRDILGGERIGVVIEATGSPEAVATSLKLAGEGARVVLLGSTRGTAQVDVYSTIHRKGLNVIGAHVDLSDHPVTVRDPWTRGRNLDLAMRLCMDGSLKTDILVSHQITPEQIPATYERMLSAPDDCLGVVIDWTRLPQR